MLQSATINPHPHERAPSTILHADRQALAQVKSVDFSLRSKAELRDALMDPSRTYQGAPLTTEALLARALFCVATFLLFDSAMLLIFHVLRNFAKKLMCSWLASLAAKFTRG